MRARGSAVRHRHRHAGGDRAHRLQRPAHPRRRPRARRGGARGGHPVLPEHGVHRGAGGHRRHRRAPLDADLSLQGPRQPRRGGEAGRARRLRGDRADHRRLGVRQPRVGPPQLPRADEAHLAQRARCRPAPALDLRRAGTARHATLPQPRRLPAAGHGQRVERRCLPRRADGHLADLGRCAPPARAVAAPATGEGRAAARGRAAREGGGRRRRGGDEPRRTPARRRAGADRDPGRGAPGGGGGDDGDRGQRLSPRQRLRQGARARRGCSDVGAGDPVRPRRRRRAGRPCTASPPPARRALRARWRSCAARWSARSA